MIGLVGCSVERAQRSETGFGIDRDCDCENRIQGVRELSTDMRSSLSGYVLIVTNRHLLAVSERAQWDRSAGGEVGEMSFNVM